jgi:NDP-sugar pyrophosphorylase family protein
MQIVILAGGLATRMRPVTEKIPKALIPVNHLPFVHFQLEYLAKQGIKRVIFSVGYKGEMIQDYVGDGSRWGLEAVYTHEGKNLLGTGGAVRLAFDQGLLDEEFFVIYGDSFLPISFQEVWDAYQRGNEPALMTVLENAGKWDTSNVCFENGRVVLYDKKISPKPPSMKFIDYGLLILNRDLISQRISSGLKYDLSDLLHQLSVDQLLQGFEVKSRFYEIGSFSGLEDFKEYILGQS